MECGPCKSCYLNLVPAPTPTQETIPNPGILTKPKPLKTPTQNPTNKSMEQKATPKNVQLPVSGSGKVPIVTPTKSVPEWCYT